MRVAAIVIGLGAKKEYGPSCRDALFSEARPFYLPSNLVGVSKDVKEAVPWKNWDCHNILHFLCLLKEAVAIMLLALLEKGHTVTLLRCIK